MAITDNLVGYWKMEWNAKDSSGNNNHGADTFQSYSSGKIWQSLVVNANTSAKVFIPYSSSLSIGGYVSVNCWINTNWTWYIWSIFWNISGGTGFQLSVLSPWWIHFSIWWGTSSSPQNSVPFSGFAMVTAIYWWNYIKLYVNGNIVLQWTWTNSITPSTGGSYLWDTWASTSQYIDEVAVWNRDISADVSTLYNAWAWYELPIAKPNYYLNYFNS